MRLHDITNSLDVENITMGRNLNEVIFYNFKNLSLPVMYMFKITFAIRGYKMELSSGKKILIINI